MRCNARINLSQWHDLGRDEVILTKHVRIFTAIFLVTFLLAGFLREASASGERRLLLLNAAAQAAGLDADLSPKRCLDTWGTYTFCSLIGLNGLSELHAIYAKEEIVPYHIRLRTLLSAQICSGDGNNELGISPKDYCLFEF